MLRVKPQTLKSRLHRGRLILRERLARFRRRRHAPHARRRELTARRQARAALGMCAHISNAFSSSVCSCRVSDGSSTRLTPSSPTSTGIATTDDRASGPALAARTKHENRRRDRPSSPSTTRDAADASAYGPGGQRLRIFAVERRNLMRRQLRRQRQRRGGALLPTPRPPRAAGRRRCAARRRRRWCRAGRPQARAPRTRAPAARCRADAGAAPSARPRRAPSARADRRRRTRSAPLRRLSPAAAAPIRPGFARVLSARRAIVRDDDDVGACRRGPASADVSRVAELLDWSGLLDVERLALRHRGRRDRSGGPRRPGRGRRACARARRRARRTRRSR